ncbi:hypothetical protein Q4543_17755 [Salipiger sp. 1_MG-2023]|uniref:hypothetical protein n=1 Tax=Salipiger sp. 1_MG-2023 TaxID=3062665 RepID=UPI0026E466A0|nr:hypothetical protein [Salipiger sp. 1_MG-2023]MDO6587361.1 hypothetical protein [Salipiger sp. 1_MG-2023]
MKHDPVKHDWDSVSVAERNRAIADRYQAIGKDAALSEMKARANAVWAKMKASQREQRTKQDAFIGPRTRRPMRPLADHAQAHIDAGGCSGDLCRTCSGQGWRLDEYDHDKWTDARCDWCNGSGLGA